MSPSASESSLKSDFLSKRLWESSGARFWEDLGSILESQTAWKLTKMLVELSNEFQEDLRRDDHAGRTSAEPPRSLPPAGAGPPGRGRGGVL